jgi:hypothetical protein
MTPDQVEYKAALGLTLRCQGKALAQLALGGTAVVVLRSAVAHHRQALARAPKADGGQRALAQSCQALAQCLARQDRLDWQQVQNDADLKPLHGRPEFSRFRLEVAANNLPVSFPH